MPLAIVALEVTFFDVICWFVNLDDKRELRGRDVLLDVPICLHEVSEETCFVELNLCWCRVLIWCDVVWSLEFHPLILFVGCLRLVWGIGSRDVLEVGVLGVGVLKQSLYYLKRDFNLRGWWLASGGREPSGSWRILSRPSNQISSLPNEYNFSVYKVLW